MGIRSVFGFNGVCGFLRESVLCSLGPRGLRRVVWNGRDESRCLVRRRVPCYSML